MATIANQVIIPNKYVDAAISRNRFLSGLFSCIVSSRKSFYHGLPEVFTSLLFWLAVGINEEIVADGKSSFR